MITTLDTRVCDIGPSNYGKGRYHKLAEIDDEEDDFEVNPFALIKGTQFFFYNPSRFDFVKDPTSSSGDFPCVPTVDRINYCNCAPVLNFSKDKIYIQWTSSYASRVTGQCYGYSPEAVGAELNKPSAMLTTLTSTRYGSALSSIVNDAVYYGCRIYSEKGTIYQSYTVTDHTKKIGFLYPSFANYNITRGVSYNTTKFNSSLLVPAGYSINLGFFGLAIGPDYSMLGFDSARSSMVEGSFYRTSITCPIFLDSRNIDTEMARLATASALVNKGDYIRPLFNFYNVVALETHATPNFVIPAFTSGTLIGLMTEVGLLNNMQNRLNAQFTPIETDRNNLFNSPTYTNTIFLTSDMRDLIYWFVPADRYYALINTNMGSIILDIKPSTEHRTLLSVKEVGGLADSNKMLYEVNSFNPEEYIYLDGMGIAKYRFNYSKFTFSNIGDLRPDASVPFEDVADVAVGSYSMTVNFPPPSSYINTSITHKLFNKPLTLPVMNIGEDPMNINGTGSGSPTKATSTVAKLMDTDKSHSHLFYPINRADLSVSESYDPGFFDYQRSFIQSNDMTFFKSECVDDLNKFINPIKDGHTEKSLLFFGMSSEYEAMNHIFNRAVYECVRGVLSETTTAFENSLTPVNNCQNIEFVTNTVNLISFVEQNDINSLHDMATNYQTVRMVISWLQSFPNVWHNPSMNTSRNVFHYRCLSRSGENLYYFIKNTVKVNIKIDSSFAPGVNTKVSDYSCVIIPNPLNALTKCIGTVVITEKNSATGAAPIQYVYPLVIENFTVTPIEIEIVKTHKFDGVFTRPQLFRLGNKFYTYDDKSILEFEMRGTGNTQITDTTKADDEFVELELVRICPYPSNHVPFVQLLNFDKLIMQLFNNNAKNVRPNTNVAYSYAPYK